MADLLIATKAFCNTLKAGSFTGDTTMCPTRSQIEAAGLYIKKGYTYATDQLVPQDHIERLDWEYTFSVTPTTATISAAGGSQKFTVTSYKRQYSYSNAGNRIYVEGSQTNVGYTSSNSGSGTWTAANDTISYGANTGSTQPGGTITWTQSESFGSDPKKTATATHKQNADSIKPNGDGYSNPRITAFSYPTVIPAAGGNSTPSYSYEQTVYWVSGKTTTLTSGGTPTFNRTSGTATVNSSSGLANTGSKGTTQSGQTTVAVVSLTITMNGKSSSASSANVYQAENKIERQDSWGAWYIEYLTLGKTTFEKEGGSTTITTRARRDGKNVWSSGERTDTYDTATPNLSSNVSWATISGTTLNVSLNTSYARDGKVTATYSGASKSVDFHQAVGRLVNDTRTVYSISVTPTTMTWEYNQTSGKSFTVTCRGQYQEYCSYDGGSTYNWENVGSATTANYTESLSNTSEFTLSGSSVSVKSSNTTLYDKTGTVTFTCSSDTSKKASISLRQRADVQEDTRYRVVVSPTSLVFESTAGSQRVNVTPQYQTVRWATGTTKPSWPSSWSDSSSSSWSVSLSADSGISQSPSYSNGYATVSVTANPSETSERTGTLTVWHDSDKYGTSTDVSLRQRKKDRIEYEYEYLYSFSATPTSLSYPKEGGTKSVSVTSTVQSRSRTIINGSAGSWSNWGTASSVGYTGSVSGTGFSLSGNNGATAGSNSNSSERTGTLTLKQTRSSTPVNSSSSSSTISIQLRQDANITTISDGYQYEHELSVSKTSFDASGGSATISVTSRRREIYHMSNAPTTYLTTSWESWSSTQTVSGTGFSKSGNTLNVSSNSSTSSRTGNVDSSQNQPNKCSLSSYQSDSSSLNVPLNQEGKKEDVYVFLVSPPFITFNTSGGERTLSITSTKNDSVIGYSYSWKAMLSQFTFSNGTIFASAAGTLGRSDTLTLTQDESGKIATINVSQSGSGGGGEILDDCIITVKYISTGVSANAIRVNADKTPTSNLTINITASYTKPDNSKTYSGMLTSSISKGSNQGSSVFFSDLIDDIYNWDGNGTCRVNFVTVSPTKDNTYNYNTKVTEI